MIDVRLEPERPEAVVRDRKAEHERERAAETVDIAQPRRLDARHLDLPVHAQRREDLHEGEGDHDGGEPGLEVEGRGEEEREQGVMGRVVETAVDPEGHRHRPADEQGGDQAPFDGSYIRP